MFQVRVADMQGLLLVALCCMVPAVASALPAFEYRSALAVPGGSRPSAVSLAVGNRSLCVTDEATCGLDVYDDQGFLRFQTSSLAGLSSPQDASIDARGDFVFTDRAGKRSRTIRRLNFLGEPMDYDPELPREGWYPRHLVIAEDGNYITLDTSGLLAKHDAATGKLMWKLQVMDPEAEFVDLMGRPAVAPDGKIYVPDPGGRSVLVVSGDGRLLATFGESGSKRGTFAFPVGIAFGSPDQILVLDRMRHRILVFDADYEFVTEFGRLGYGTGEMYHPVAITAAADGRIWIAQGYKGRVQMFRLRDTESIPGTSSRFEPVHNNKGETQ